MKKLLILLALSCCSFCFGQRKAVLDTIQRFISARIDDPKLKAPIDDFFANYLSAKPISEGMLWDDKAGICIDVLTGKNRVVYYPAKYDVGWVDMTFNAFSIEDKEDPAGKEQYVQQFLKNERNKIQKSAYFNHVKFQYSNDKTEKSKINTGDILIENKHHSAFFKRQSKLDTAAAYLLPLLASYYYEKETNEKLIAYIPDKKKSRTALKNDIDKALLSARTTDHGNIEITFRRHKVAFWYHNIPQFLEVVKKSNFYKSL